MREIHEVFQKAALQHEAASGLDENGWGKYRQILSEHEQRQRFELRQFQLEYQTRVEVARKSLIDQAGTKGRSFVPRFLGRDGFDKAAIDRQAHRQVQQEHERLMSRLEDGKVGRLNELLGTAEAHQQLRAQLKTDFSDAANRRSGQERRSGPTR